MPYQQLLCELKELADDEYKNFHKKLLKNDDIAVLGVRIPVLRKIARSYKDRIDELLSFPDEFYEVTFVKLTAVSYLKYEQFIKYVDKCVPLINNWATCDCFKAKCIQNHRDEFLPYIFKYAQDDGEFYQRYALVTLLHFYVEEKYADIIFSLCDRCDKSLYYVHMAVAWLVAETLVKFYERAKGYLLQNSLDKKTNNKAIQKACESFRLSQEQKTYLKGLKK